MSFGGGERCSHCRDSVPVNRGSFHARYIVPKEARHANQTTPRLLDCLASVAPYGDPDYMEYPTAGQFVVVDVVTQEKAWFEMPYGATPEMVTGMVSSSFNATAYRVGPKLWFV